MFSAVRTDNTIIAYCFWLWKVHVDPTLASFDRINPAKGYTKGNVRIISLRANRLKFDCVDPEELRRVANYIERCNAEIKDNST